MYMTQIAIVQPAAPQISPAGPPVSGDKQQFSSHFDKAISNRKDQLNTRNLEGNNPSRNSSNKNDVPATAKNTEAGDAPITVTPPADETIPTVPVVSSDEMAEQNPADAVLQTEISVESPYFFISVNSATPTDTALTATDNAMPAGDPANAGKEAVLPIARVVARGLTVPSAVPSALLQTESSDFAALPEATTPPAATQNGPKSATDALLAQIQQIISNSDEKGAVTIAKVNTTNATPPTTINDGRLAQTALPQPAANSLGQIHIGVSSEFTESRPEAPAFVVSEGFRLPTEKSDNQPASLRQNTQQQYLEAKINLQSNNQEDSTPQQNKQQSGEPGTSVPSAAGTNSSAQPILGEQPNTFSQSLAAVQSTPSLPASEGAKTITLPSGVVVHEEDVVRQVLERFQISQRSFDTRINIKLHPAELGELKIDLSVKEGSIRANVVAQSQHAQEIIERNMVKLKTILEEQGFTIDKITVTSKFDSTGDANLFDRQLFDRDNYTPQSNKRRNSSKTGFSLDEAILSAQPAATGVNVKI
jgi:flagellar hook-length control protein FliK